MDKKIFEYLDKTEIHLRKIEDELYKIQPYLFINLLGIRNVFIPKVINAHAKNLPKYLDYQNKSLVQLIKDHSIATDKISEIPGLNLWGINNIDGSTEAKFLKSLSISQQIRSMLERKPLALYSLQKVMSKAEKAIFGLPDMEINGERLPRIDLYEFLYVDEFGDFDLENTLKTEHSEKNISSFFSSAQSIYYQGNFIQNELENNSKHIAFSILNKDITETLSTAASSVITSLYSRIVYQNIERGVKVANAKALTRKHMQKIALEYINNGNSKNDDIHLAKQVFDSVESEFESIDYYDDKFKESVIKEVLRISMILVLKDYYMPDDYFSLEFREASFEEKEISPEITHSLDLFKMNEVNEIDRSLFETYIISIQQDIKQQIYFLASRGVQNPKYIDDMVDKLEEPSAMARITKKLIDAVPE